MSTSFERRSMNGLLLSACAGSQLCATPVQGSVRKMVFRIGEFNRSSAEFASGDKQQKVNFVSKGDPRKDWFGAHRATVGLSSKQQATSLTSAPRSIRFSLEGAAAENYRLHVALRIESASVPTLKVGINGKEGIFYLHPVLDYNNGDQYDSVDLAYTSADVELTFPGSYLSAGTNAITLQPVEETDGATPDAGITFDAIESDSVLRSADSGSCTAQVIPTIFFHSENGEMWETVDAFLRCGKRTDRAAPN